MDAANRKLLIDASFTVSAVGCADRRLEAAVSRLSAQIARQTGIATWAASAADPT